jgi:preprotein translocase subunit SecD
MAHRQRYVLLTVLLVQLALAVMAIVFRDNLVDVGGALTGSGKVFAWSCAVIFVVMLALLLSIGATASTYVFVASAVLLRIITSTLNDSHAWLVVAIGLVLLQWLVAFQPHNAEGTRRVLFTATVVMVLSAFVGTLVSSARPQLGLDLQGGISVRLFPVKGTDPSLLPTARQIIENRVNGLGVAEPEVSVQGSTIVVDLPGVKDRQHAEQVVGTTAELQNRVVLNAFPVGVPLSSTPTTVAGTPTTVAGSPTTAAGSPTTAAGSPTTAAISPGTSTAPTTTPAKGSGAQSRTIATTPIAARAAATTTPTTASTATTVAGATTTTAAGVTPTTAKTFTCSDLVSKTAPKATATAFFWDQPDPKTHKHKQCYELGPSVLSGTSVTGASAIYDATKGWTVNVSYRGQSFVTAVATPYVNKQVAIVLDNIVLSAPTINPGITGSDVQITGSFTDKEAHDLALALKYGSLPVRFDDKQKTVENVSPSLGRDQLRAGLAAGVIGLILVALYMLAFYRVLGIVVWIGLVLTGMIMFTLVTLLGQSQNLTLTLSGVTGIIVSVGVTVDSYVVYFERLKDEVRTGKTVRSSVDTGWRRAWRTIVAADAVSLIGAGVLYALTIGSVKGFAYFLALSTIVDLVLAWCYMHPLVSMMARRSGLVAMRGMGISSGLDLDVAGTPA